MNFYKLKYLCLVFILAASNVRCKLDTSGVIEPTTETLVLSSIVITPDSVNTDSIFVNGTQTPDDNITLTTTIYVKANRFGNQISLSASVKDFRQGFTLNSVSLKDDGIFPDGVMGDSVYTGTVHFSVKRSYFGKLNISVSGGSAIATSPSISIPYTVTRNNRPPIVDSVDVPDTLVVGSSIQLLNLFAYVRDEDGSADIAQVFFRSYLLPDTTNGSNPFSLYDDGGENKADGNTDKIPGDGKYTLTVQFPPTAIKGTRRFVFQASDKSGALSNSVKHDIIIK